MVCDKMVFDRWCVTKLRVKLLCERWYVTRWYVTKLCVKFVCV